MTDPELLPILRALTPYLDQLVIVGAWCHRLLRFHPLAAPTADAALMTEDADVATPEQLPRRSPNLDEALTAGGFRARLFGEGKVPITRYYPVADDRGLYLELVAPLRGSGYTRRGDPDDVLAISGATAQRLRHVDLLLFDPWTHTVGERTIRIANPASYLAQKVLTLRKRATSAKQAKDALYLHDTLVLFGASLAELRGQAARVLDQLLPKTRRELHELRVSLFRDRALAIGAARIATATGRANPPSPDTIAAACTAGLQQIFG